MVKICFVGGEDVFRRIPLLRALHEKGFEVCAIGCGNVDKFHEAEIEYYHYNLEMGFSPVADVFSFFQLGRILRNLNPDIIHSFDTKPSILMPLASIFVGNIRTVRTITGMGNLFSSRDFKSYFLRLLYRVLQRMVSSVSDVTVFQNSDDFAYFKKFDLSPSSKMDLVQSSGVDLNFFSKSKINQRCIDAVKVELNLDKTFNVIMVSRLISNKGVREFLAAGKIIVRKHPNVRFLLVGSIPGQPNESVFRDVIQSYSDCVLWLGERTDIRELLALSDVFVLPSYYREGVPRVLLEAGAMGLPLITTNMPGCREVVADGWNGFLVRARSVEALVEALERVLELDDQGKSMGLLSVEYIRDHFDLLLIANSYIKIYKNLIQITK